MPELSIITVCFNEAARIALTCESIVNQTFQDFEWIVIDGGSTDGTLEILKRYAPRMNYVVSEPDRGIYHAMNKGIAQAHGMYLLFLNGGDYLYQPDVLAKVVDGNQPFIFDIYYGDLLMERVDKFKHYSRDFTNYYSMFMKKPLPHQATFIKRTLFECYGGYDESLIIAADFDFVLRVFVSNPNRHRHTIVHLPYIIAVYENSQGLSSRYIDLREVEYRYLRRKHYPALYRIHYSIQTWLTEQKNRILDSATYRFKRFVKRERSCRKSA